MMTRLIALVALLLTGCSGTDIGSALSASRAGCARTTGPWGSVVITTANADKSSKTDDEVTINPDSCAMTIRNTGNAGMKPVPGSVTTITIPPSPGTVQTIVTPVKP